MDLHQLLGDETDALSPTSARACRREDLVLPGPGLHRPSTAVVGPSRPCPAQPRPAAQHGPLGRHRLHFDPARRPGHRALRRGQLCAEPDLFRPEEHRRAGHRGGLQRRGHHRWGAGHGRPALRPQDPLHRQAQPQRAAQLPQHPRPGDVRLRPAGFRDWRRGRRGHRLLGRRGVPPRDAGSLRGLRRGACAGDVHRFVVLSAQQCVQEGRRQLRVRPPT